MPHQCTDCGRQFDDGSKEMLSGCPACGGTKFQFLPDGQTDPEPSPEEPATVEDSTSSVARTVGSAATAVRDLVGGSRDDPPTRSTERPPTPSSGGEPTASPEPSPTTQQASAPASEATDRGASSPSVGSETASPEQLGEPDPAAMRTADSENDAQASARSEVVSPDELPPAPEQSGWDQATPTAATESDVDETVPEDIDRPDLSELRAELNQQFESIKVLEPGQYELNLMELFDREEYIIALQEDGKYTVQVPEHWQE